MRVGGTRVLRIPPNLAYGDRGAGEEIPPGSHLEFECQLLKVPEGPVEKFLAQSPGFPFLMGLVLIAAVSVALAP